jgi:hypothetical protein
MSNVNNEIEISENDLKAVKYKNALAKVRFINEVKGSLGDDIKGGRGFRMIKIPWQVKLKRVIKKFFKLF